MKKLICASCLQAADTMTETKIPKSGSWFGAFLCETLCFASLLCSFRTGFADAGHHIFLTQEKLYRQASNPALNI